MLALAMPFAASAHHSFAASFETDTIIELEGQVVALRWQNPHVEFDLRVPTEGAGERLWTIETDSLPGLRGRNIDAPFVAVGDTVRIAGNPARRGQSNVYLTNILLASNEELVLRSNNGPRFSDRLVSTTGTRDATAGDSSAPELGIFRVWTTPSASPFPFPEDVSPERAHTDFPLTAAAQAVLESFDLIADSPIRNCTLKGMPVIMEQPYPMEFSEDGGDILLHAEEYDTIRRIYMDDATAPEPTPGILGYSRGHWEGNTLVVATTDVNFGWFDTVGIPLSENAEITERFTLASDGSRLDWTMRVVDPATFTEPITLEKFWLYVPGVEVHKFACTPDE